MKAKELRDKSTDEVRAAVGDLRKQLFDLEFKHGTRQLNDTSSILKTRRDIARAVTVLKEKEAVASAG